MADPKKREETIRRRYANDFTDSNLRFAARDVNWLLAELARLRTEAQHMQAALTEVLGSKDGENYMRHVAFAALRDAGAQPQP